MRIDPKYFNHFMVVLAVTGVITIALASLYYVGKQEQRFLGRLDNSDPSGFRFVSLQGDTLALAPDRNVVLLFWATWSDRSVEELDDLYGWHAEHPEYEVVAAFVKDAAEFAEEHERPGRPGFHIADGTGVYQDLRVPGVPTAIIFGPGHRVTHTQAGSGSRPAWREMERN